MSALPATMSCVEIKTPGGPEALVPTTRPVPQPKDGEILIKVAAVGVNRPDIAQRAGLYPPPPGASDLPGLEAAGTVAALGAGVTGWQVGDALCALTPGGGQAGIEGGACAAQEAVHCGFAHVEDLGDLSRLEAEHVAQDEYGPLLRWEVL